jgi:transcriptional regulator with XRE-family HTH domain
MSPPTIFGFSSKPAQEVMADVGTALLQIKNARGLSLIDMASVMGRGDDMVAKYIAGEAEMGFIAWGRANDEWPELAEKIAETSAERAARLRQRLLDLEFPNSRREKAA